MSGLKITTVPRDLYYDEVTYVRRLEGALGKALTAMLFEAERATREQDGVALTQLHEAIMAARTALKQ